jgi:hypothetical protein
VSFAYLLARLQIRLPTAHGWEEANFGVFGDVLDDALGGLLVVDEDGDRGVDAAFEHEGTFDAGALGFEEVDDAPEAAAAGQVDVNGFSAIAEGAEGGGDVDGDHGVIFARGGLEVEGEPRSRPVKSLRIAGALLRSS